MRGFISKLASNQRNLAFMPTNIKQIVPTFQKSVPAIKQIFEQYCPENNADRPLYVQDLGAVYRQYNRWMAHLPKIRPFYAIKCNPHEEIIKELASLGAGFDCASKGEISNVLKQDVSPENIIFANPIKSFHDLEYAKQVGVKKMTFDNVEELHKIKHIFPNSELILRLRSDDSGSVMRFSSKFGASFEQSIEILTVAQELGLKVIGTSFHIGSGCFDPTKYNIAIKMCRDIFNLANHLGMARMNFLDIGGGFPGNPHSYKVNEDGTPSFETFASIIAASISKHFPEKQFHDLQIISEPGRYFAHNSGTLFTKVLGKRTEIVSDGTKRFLYYINDGVYGTLNSIIYDYAKPIPLYLEEYFEVQRTNIPAFNNMSASLIPSPPLMFPSAMNYSTSIETFMATIFGPTCDSLDVVISDHHMRELHVGEWIVFNNMGAYTTASGSEFNGCPKPVIATIRSIDV